MESNAGEPGYRRERYARRGERLAVPAILAALALLAGLAALLPAGPAQERTGTEYLLAAQQPHERTPVGDMIDIEDAWAIEDTRNEAGGGILVQKMFNGESALGYDAGSDTFYCTLGMENEMDWPELALSVQDAPGVTVVWIDDYAYDDCAEAIREGYRYELLAYTETEYAYFGVVFTGLPIIAWHSYDADTPIGEEYVPGYGSVSAAGYEAVSSAAKMHTRGGGFPKPVDKLSYRLEFHELSRKGRDRTREVGVLGMEPDSDWLLVSQASDSTVMRSHLCWKLWSRWNEGEAVPCQLDSRMIELFVDDEYMGLYELMPRIRPEKELERIGGSTATDYVYRAFKRADKNYQGRERLVIDRLDTISTVAELRHAPAGFSEETAIRLFEPYVQLNTYGEAALSDEAFADLALSVVDMRQAMSYFLYFHACQLIRDNVENNRYIWMLREDGGYRMMITPWDMDNGLGCTDEIKGDDIIFLGLTMEQRLLDLNVGGCRELMWEIWEEKKNTLLTEDAIYAWIRGEEAYINASGAYLRESERWYGEAQELNLSQMYENELAYIGTIDAYLRELWPLGARGE